MLSIHSLTRAVRVSFLVLFCVCSCLTPCEPNQVLISIQSLIFVAEPYFNEPGYEGQLGTPQVTIRPRVDLWVG